MIQARKNTMWKAELNNFR